MNQTSFLHDSNMVPNQLLIIIFINKLFDANSIIRIRN